MFIDITAIIKKRLKLDMSLYTILQILSVTVFEKIPITRALADDEYKYTLSESIIDNQPNLFS